MRQRGLCCRPVSVCLSLRPSVYLSRRWIISTRAEDIVKILVRLGAPSFWFVDPMRWYPILTGNPFSRVAKYMECWKILRFSTEIAVYLGNGAF